MSVRDTAYVPTLDDMRQRYRAWSDGLSYDDEAPDVFIEALEAEVERLSADLAAAREALRVVLSDPFHHRLSDSTYYIAWHALNDFPTTPEQEGTE